MGSEYRLSNGTRCMAPEMELFTRMPHTALRGKAWQHEAKPGGGGGNVTYGSFIAPPPRHPCLVQSMNFGQPKNGTCLPFSLLFSGHQNKNHSAQT